MRKEIHVIDDTGKMKSGCDQHPLHSLQPVKVDQNEIRWTLDGRNSIHPDIGSKPYQKTAVVGNMCYNCGNTFTENAEFVDEDCKRCHERKTLVNRN